ncbi:hypothetical protein OXB_2879 [Bacillus sp. OxB-1]|uniref:hypothetical protein n=1 Tax=Bacillus sp. (strain OxB-1) TaxID=98228 RepID=UPI000582141D|nr:hypothetical protein [Bacillus sp. OxB-1]BAQ11350.1 hypothetical protein OXB_2879 [Bacillus sp. OxB-1]
MKLENYRKEDIEEVIELKKMAQHQINKVELHNWTDDIDKAINRTLALYQLFSKIRSLKNAQSDERKMEFLAAKLAMGGIQVQSIHFGHKKTD